MIYGYIYGFRDGVMLSRRAFAQNIRIVLLSVSAVFQPFGFSQVVFNTDYSAFCFLSQWVSVQFGTTSSSLWGYCEELQNTNNLCPRNKPLENCRKGRGRVLVNPCFFPLFKSVNYDDNQAHDGNVEPIKTNYYTLNVNKVDQEDCGRLRYKTLRGNENRSKENSFAKKSCDKKLYLRGTMGISIRL